MGQIGLQSPSASIIENVPAVVSFPIIELGGTSSIIIHFRN